MKVAELIEMLKKADPESEAMIWDPETEGNAPVTGMTYGKGEKTYLYCDED